MLRIKDKSGKTKFVWSDDAEEPISVDELVLKETKEKEGDPNASKLRQGPK